MKLSSVARIASLAALAHTATAFTGYICPTAGCAGVCTPAILPDSTGGCVRVTTLDIFQPFVYVKVASYSASSVGLEVYGDATCTTNRLNTISNVPLNGVAGCKADGTGAYVYAQSGGAPAPPAPTASGMIVLNVCVGSTCAQPCIPATLKATGSCQPVTAAGTTTYFTTNRAAGAGTVSIQAYTDAACAVSAGSANPPVGAVGSTGTCTVPSGALAAGTSIYVTEAPAGGGGGGSSGLGTGAIIGIVVGAVAGVAIIGALVYFLVIKPKGAGQPKPLAGSSQQQQGGSNNPMMKV